jgi:hypothetical protein
MIARRYDSVNKKWRGSVKRLLDVQECNKEMEEITGQGFVLVRNHILVR